MLSFGRDLLSHGSAGKSVVFRLPRSKAIKCMVRSKDEGGPDDDRPTRRRLPKYPVTPDGRYFVVRGRLWRTTVPSLDPDRRNDLTQRLMAARRGIRVAKRDGDAAAMEAARATVDATKVALGERGPVWWTDGAPDFNRCRAKNTPYSEWFDALA